MNEPPAETKPKKPGTQGRQRGNAQRVDEFIDIYLATNNGAEAYRQAYKRHDLAPVEAGNRAYRILRRPAVKKRMAALVKKSEAKSILSLNDQLAILARNAQAKGSGASMINATTRAVEVYAKIAGTGAPERHEISGPGGAPLMVASVELRAAPIRKRIEALVAAKLRSAEAMQ